MSRSLDKTCQHFFNTIGVCWYGNCFCFNLELRKLHKSCVAIPLRRGGRLQMPPGDISGLRWTCYPLIADAHGHTHSKGCEMSLLFLWTWACHSAALRLLQSEKLLPRCHLTHWAHTSSKSMPGPGHFPETSPLVIPLTSWLFFIYRKHNSFWE